MIRPQTVATHGQGLFECTDAVQSAVREGLCTLFIQHTSASLVIC